MSEIKVMKIAITGTIGSGKSTVCEYLCTKGYDVFNCDKQNSILLQYPNEGYMKVKEAFQECVKDNELDKKLLASIVFNDKDKKDLLESIMHPLILKEMNKRTDNPLICEVPLLFEADWDKYFDVNVLVISDIDIIRNRLRLRGMEEDDIESRLKNQMSVEEKIKRADKIIYNNGSLTDLYIGTDRMLQQVLC